MDRDRINHICLLILTTIALTVGLIYAKTILIPFTLSLFIYIIFSPGIKWLQQHLKLPKSIAIALAVTIFFTLWFTLLLLIGSSLENFFNDAETYRDRVLAFTVEMKNWLQGFGITVNQESIRQELQQISLFQMAKNITGGVFSFFGTTTLIIIFVLFMVAGERENQGSDLLNTIKKPIRKYLFTKLTLSITTGVLVGIILMIFGVELAITFSILTILLNFIPSIGSIIATLLPVPILILQFSLQWQFWLILLLTGLIQFLIGNVLEPKIMGGHMALHPVTILFFLMFWGLVWGVPGMFLSVPMTAILKIILNQIEQTKPIARLLAGELPGRDHDLAHS